MCIGSHSDWQPLLAALDAGAESMRAVFPHEWDASGVYRRAHAHYAHAKAGDDALVSANTISPKYKVHMLP